MKKVLLVLLIVLSLLCNNKAGAECIVGADMGWTCVGKDSFLIKLQVYMDCNGIPLSPTPIFFKCASTGTRFTSLTIGVGTPIDITPLCSSSCSRCTNPSCSFPYGVRKYTIQGIVKLNSAGSCCNITISWEWCCRTSMISTGAGGQNLYIEAKLNRCLNPCDNSPTFTNTPLPVLCTNQDISFNHGAIDVNNSGNMGDSLTYEWVCPLSGANTPIAYTGLYTSNKPISFFGFPNDALSFPRGMHLDPQTGDIQFRPTKAEFTVMVIQVNEFRNGVKIGEIRRDMSVIVIPCLSNNSPVVTTPNNVRSKTVCAGDTVSFNFVTNDPNANDSVTISWNNALPGAVWTHTNGLSKHPTATLTWITNAARTSSLPYSFTVTAKDNACPLRAQFTQSYQITVNPYPVPLANITISDSGCGKYYFKAMPIIGTLPTYKWSSDSFTFSPNTGPLVSHNFSTGRYPFKLDMTASGCSKSFYDTVKVDPFLTVSLPQDTSVCYNSTISLQATFANAKSPYKLKWGSGKVTFNGDSNITKQVTVTRDTTIWVRATYGPINCPYDEIRIKVHPQNKISLPDDTSFCDLNNLLTPRFLPNKNAFGLFRWYKVFSTVIVDSDAYLNLYDTGLFSCVATDTFGCIVSDSVRVHKNPEINASAIDRIICYGDEVDLKASTTGGGSARYYWYNGTKLLGSTQNIKVNPLTTTSYTLKVLENTAGITCQDSMLVWVKVEPLPVIKISPIDKRCVNGTVLFLNDFVTVSGIYHPAGIWTSVSSGIITGDIFDPRLSGVSSPPGWKVRFDYKDPMTGCYNHDSSYITVLPLPNPYAGADEPVCRGTKKMLAGTPSLPPGTWRGKGVGGSFSNWIFNPDTSGIADGQSYDVIYHYTDNNKCENEDTVKFRVSPRPARPVISLTPSDSFLECNLTKGDYNWFYRTDTFNNPTNININSKKINPGNYCNSCYFSVVYTDSNGCVSDTSVAFHFVVNSIDQKIRSSHFIFYPNPAHRELFIENPNNETASFMLTDIFGNIVLEKKIPSGKSSISTLTYKPGVYFIFIDGMIAGKLLIE